MKDNLKLLQQDLDTLMQFYNDEHTHTDRHCYGKTPMKTFLESLSLTKVSLIQYRELAYFIPGPITLKFLAFR